MVVQQLASTSARAFHESENDLRLLQEVGQLLVQRTAIRLENLLRGLYCGKKVLMFPTTPTRYLSTSTWSSLVQFSSCRASTASMMATISFAVRERCLSSKQRPHCLHGSALFHLVILLCCSLSSEDDLRSACEQLIIWQKEL
ncbi:hypothetical protein QR680_008956 [Steinernema hermaphroditum]|uniref:Uncharacterized protein n=1 Tax=Steinernema hermaphroditum TaxID=289476 RepID=A0AA39IIJ3_9BILA|nr:hypothetical protein QR680_008956 [Steinernema hermaphroditum]